MIEKMRKPLFNGISIITIVLNGESLIEETIKSVIFQENVPIEYIIIDGGSTDGTLEKIKKYQSKIDLLISEPDKGIYSAINKGIKLANNDLIGLIHCGDFYEPDTLQTVYNAFKENHADVIYGDIKIIEEYSIQNIVHYNKANHNLLQKQMSIFHPATFVARECYLKYGLYNTNYKITADYELILNLYLRNVKFEYIPQVLADFRKGGISGSRLNLLFKENFLIRKKLLGLKSALIYIFSEYPIHIYHSLRKSCIESIVGKNNYFKIKQRLYNRKSLTGNKKI